MQITVDLHSHTTCSDGVLTPEALVKRASEKGLKILAITDHDTTNGLVDGREAAGKVGILLVAGVELSVRFDGRELHVLGYFFDPSHANLVEFIGRYRTARWDRASRIVDNLNKIGVSLDFERLRVQLGDIAIGRPHIAKELVEQGWVESYDVAFEKYLHNGGPAAAEKELPPISEALSVLHSGGGIGVLAHPGHWVSDRDVKRMKDYGLDGIEVFHPSHDETISSFYKNLAENLGMLITGGSDFHGMRAGDDTNMGRIGLTMEQYEMLTTS